MRTDYSIYESNIVILFIQESQVIELSETERSFHFSKQARKFGGW